MIEQKFPHLFMPARIRGVRFKNRLMASPQGNYFVSPQRIPGREWSAFYERKAKGGFASVAVGDCIVDPQKGMNLPWVLNMEDPDMKPRLADTALGITSYGAIASAELSHDGEYSPVSRAIYGGELKGVTEHDNQYGHVYPYTVEEIEEIIDKYAKAAAFVTLCGFNMITFHAGHGWLPGQFMSPKVNTRDDEWGGSFENRMRFPIAVVEAIRKAIGPKIPIEMRFSGSEVVPEGYDIEEGIRIAKAMDGLVDILHVSAGLHENRRAWSITHPSIFCEDACNSQYARAIKGEVGKSMVATVGAWTDPYQMEEFIATGGADFIAMARQSIADPDFPTKAMLGRDDEIAGCLRCNKCFNSVDWAQHTHCSLNPEIGLELNTRYMLPVEVKKKIVVAGGGIGGMEAAIQAARRGHSVVLLEKSDKLGGVLNCEEKVPFKKNMPRYIKRQARLMEKYGVDVRLSTPATPETVEALSPDAVIASLGASAAVPPIPGIEKSVIAEKVYYDPELAQGKVVILGAGLVGIELGIWLAQLGHEVEMVEMASAPGLNMAMMPFWGYRDQLEDNNIDIHLDTRVVSIEDGRVECEHEGEKVSFAADTIVCAMGQKARVEETEALRLCAPEFYAIGDCCAPDSIMTTTRNAWYVVNNLGRM